MLEWERVVWLLGVEYGHGRWHHLVGHVVITDNEIDAKSLGILYFLDCLDAAVEDNNQFDTCFVGIVYSLLAYSIPLVVPIGYVIFYIGLELLQKLVYQGNSRASVYIVVSIDQDAFLPSHGIIQSVDSHIHILHQEGIDEVGQLWSEESLCSRFCGDASLDKKLTKDRADIELVA